MSSSIETLGFEGVGAYLQTHTAQVTEDLADYFGPFEPKLGGHTPRGFTGRFFDRLARAGEPNVFGPADIAAVATLSVPLDGHQVAALLALGPQLTSLLAAAPGPGVSLWEVDADELADEAPLSMAYDMLKTIDGIGAVRASKLMASKRPDLVPIRDELVARLLGAKEEWWLPWRGVVGEPAVRQQIAKLTPSAVPNEVSILRRLDVVLWMEAKRRLRAGNERTIASND